MIVIAGRDLVIDLPVLLEIYRLRPSAETHKGSV
jgi:hypothetical protein